MVILNSEIIGISKLNQEDIDAMYHLMTEFYDRMTYEAFIKDLKDLTLISVWNPTFLIILLEYLEDNSEKLLSSLPKRRREEISEYVKQKEYTKNMASFKGYQLLGW